MEEHEHHHHQGAWTGEHLERLMNPEREKLMPRARVLEAINLGLGSRVADVGAGMGWLTFPLAVAVGESGRVLAIDPSRDGIQAIKERAQAENLSQVEAMVATAEDTGLPKDYLDAILWHTMYHDVASRDQSLREMWRILKSGGRWIIVDWTKESTEMGPPLKVRVSAEEVSHHVTAVGFRVVDQWKAGPVTWGLTVKKP